MSDNSNKNDNLVLEFLESDEAKLFFPNQKIIYTSFNFPEIIIQTIRDQDEDIFKQDPYSKDIIVIEYKILPNYIADPNYVGPAEYSNDSKVIDEKNPFTLAIKSDLVNPGNGLDDKLEWEYLENFKKIFIKLLELIFTNLNEEDLKKLKNKEE
jgi:hypothetical protein